MTLPIHFSKGYNYDFRIIPVCIAFIYGGWLPGAATVVFLFVYRFILGGEGAYFALINFLVTGIVLCFLGKKFGSLQMKQKLLYVSLIFWANVSVFICNLFRMGRFELIRFMLVYYTITWICLLMVVFVFENVNQQFVMREKLQRDEKLNVVSQLAASVAHEVRNPLTSVRGFLQLISNDENLESSQKRYIGIAISELDRAQAIINDYLSLAKPNTEKLSTVNLSEEIRKTVELMTSYSNIQNITIKTNIEDSLYIKGNKSEIKQVLVNIFKNGIEAMETGGDLTVNAIKKNHVISIEIIDNGKGMTERQLNKLGTPFYTTKEKGTGVGLTISFQLIEAMKGKIKVDSEPGKGTIFTIQFPSLKV